MALLVWNLVNGKLGLCALFEMCSKTALEKYFLNFEFRIFFGTYISSAIDNMLSKCWICINWYFAVLFFFEIFKSWRYNFACSWFWNLKNLCFAPSLILRVFWWILNMIDLHCFHLLLQLHFHLNCIANTHYRYLALQHFLCPEKKYIINFLDPNARIWMKSCSRWIRKTLELSKLYWCNWWKAHRDEAPYQFRFVLF